MYDICPPDTAPPLKIHHRGHLPLVANPYHVHGGCFRGQVSGEGKCPVTARGWSRDMKLSGNRQTLSAKRHGEFVAGWFVFWGYSVRISQYFLSCWSRGRVASNRKVQVVFWTVCLHFRKCLVVHRSLSVQKGTHCSCLTTFVSGFSLFSTRSCATADGPRDGLQSKSCQLLYNCLFI